MNKNCKRCAFARGGVGGKVPVTSPMFDWVAAANFSLEKKKNVGWFLTKRNRSGGSCLSNKKSIQRPVKKKVQLVQKKCSLNP